MQAIVYYPRSENAQKELCEKVSQVHAEFVLDYIKRLQLPKEKSEKIIAAICRDIEKIFYYEC